MGIDLSIPGEAVDENGNLLEPDGHPNKMEARNFYQDLFKNIN